MILLAIDRDLAHSHCHAHRNTQTARQNEICYFGYDSNSNDSCVTVEISYRRLLAVYSTFIAFSNPTSFMPNGTCSASASPDDTDDNVLPLLLLLVPNELLVDISEPATLAEEYESLD